MKPYLKKTNKQTNQQKILTAPLSWIVERLQFMPQTGWQIIKRTNKMAMCLT